LTADPAPLGTVGVEDQLAPVFQLPPAVLVQLPSVAYAEEETASNEAAASSRNRSFSMELGLIYNVYTFTL